MLKAFGKDFILYGLSSSISKFVGLFLVPLYTRVFSPDQYGTMDLISTVVAITAIIGMMQLESAVSRYYYAEKNDDARTSMISTALWSILLLSGFLLSFLILFSNHISILLFGKDECSLVLIIAGLTIPFTNLNGLFTVIMRFKKKPTHYLGFQLSQIAITISITVLLVLYYKVGIIGVFIGQLSGFLVIVLLMAYYLRSNIKLRWQKTALLKMTRYSLPLVPAVGGAWANSHLNRFVMISYLSISDIGIYVVALKFASIMQLIGAAFRMAWPPFLWETFEKNSAHREVFKRVLEHVSILLFSIVIILTIFADQIIMLFATEEYSFSAKLIGILALSSAITNVLGQIVILGPGITKKTEYNTAIYLLSVAVNVASLFIFVPMIGLVGVPVSLLLGSITLVSVGWLNSERLYKVGFNYKQIIVLFFTTLSITILTYFINFSIELKSLLLLIILIFISIRYRNFLISGFLFLKSKF